MRVGKSVADNMKMGVAENKKKSCPVVWNWGKTTLLSNFTQKSCMLSKHFNFKSLVIFLSLIVFCVAFFLCVFVFVLLQMQQQRLWLYFRWDKVMQRLRFNFAAVTTTVCLLPFLCYTFVSLYIGLIWFGLVWFDVVCFDLVCFAWIYFDWLCFTLFCFVFLCLAWLGFVLLCCPFLCFALLCSLHFAL